MTEQEMQVLYEMPTFMEFISWGWLQTIMARYLAWTVNRKNRRMKRRLAWHKKYGNLQK